VEKFIGLARYAIGETGGDRLRIRWNGEPSIDLPLEQCRAAYEGAIPRWFRQLALS
jgi:hypothetical protein